MRDTQNPFALVRASDFSDSQINGLWVELGSRLINAVIEPRARISKYILGGKGTGKTHLLRYHSYQVARLRVANESGLQTVARQKFLGVYMRATNVDPGRFEPDRSALRKWQQLFGVYFELRLAEDLLDALRDIKQSSVEAKLDDAKLIREVQRSIHDASADNLTTVEELLTWVEGQRRGIDHAVDNAAFSGQLNIQISFSIGALCVPLTRGLAKWHPAFENIPVIFLLDEIENFSEIQQEVVNSLVRYGEGVLTFRITGRLYSRKTLATMARGEENREGSEFTTVELDNILRGFDGYPSFARRFVAKRLISGAGGPGSGSGAFDPTRSLEELDSSRFYDHHVRTLGLESATASFVRAFEDAVDSADTSYGLTDDVTLVVEAHLMGSFPALVQRLNLLLFCKKLKKRTNPVHLASTIADAAQRFVDSPTAERRSFYATAYGHYAVDLFAQLCRESRKTGPVYSGFDTFVKMSSGNPRNLLICLGRLYESASFRELDFTSNAIKLSIAMQTEAAADAARFAYERDSNYGSAAEPAREAINRLAIVLRTARYALSIPEVSPLAVSFSDSDIVGASKDVLRAALNYSFLFEIDEGRPDRNSQRLMRKFQLNPLLSPRWGLPIARRGDLPLSKDLVNAIFDPELQRDFEAQLRVLSQRWNYPFSAKAGNARTQPELF